MDGIEPPCVTGSCLVPPLDPAGARVMELRELLVGLHELVDASAVFSAMGGVSREELRLLALLEDEINGKEKQGAR